MIVKVEFAPSCNEVDLHCLCHGQLSVWPMEVQTAEALAAQLVRSIELARSWRSADTLDEMIERLP